LFVLRAAAQHADAAHFAKIRKRKQEAEEAKRRQDEAEVNAALHTAAAHCDSPPLHLSHPLTGLLPRCLSQSVVLNDLRFQKGRLLGFGTFGKVFEAINVQSGEIIAVKQIELRTQRAEETAKAAEQEIRMMQTLRHPNIVKLLGFNV
jgi:serine/threonine protein kinase